MKLQKKQRISNLKYCHIPTNEWTDDEINQYWNEFVECGKQENITKRQSWEKTAPSSASTASLCKKYLNQKIHMGQKFIVF